MSVKGIAGGMKIETGIGRERATDKRGLSGGGGDKEG